MINPRMTCVMCAVFVLLMSLSVPVPAGAADPANVVGADACSDCHTAESEGWRATTHFNAFSSLHRMPEARSIAGKMNIKGNVRRAELCITCHYTAQGETTSARAIAGTSCESCHGAAKEWLDLHSTPAPGSGYTLETEPAEARQQRLAKAEEMGMIRPYRLYQVVENCYQCHTVPNEELITAGGHTAGSDFELVSWLQGEVRHNFYSSGGTENREAPKDLNPANHRRVLYVMGRIVDLEYSLRAAAKATHPGVYIDAMSKRVEDAKARLNEIQSQAGNSNLATLIKEILDASGQVSVAPNNGTTLQAVADKVKAAAEKFGSNYNGSRLAGVDALIPGDDLYKGVVYGGK